MPCPYVDARVTAPGQLMLRLEGIGKRYGRKWVLDRIDADFQPGLTLLRGPSGAGKSTLLRLLATAEIPSRGRLLWDGQPLPGARRALRSALGYAPQAVDMPDDLTASEFAMHLAALKGLDGRAADAQFRAVTQRIGLGREIDNRIASFSGGMRRRLIFAQAMLGTPRLLVLDEPTAELDRDNEQRVSELILEQARTAVVVMTTHLADSLEGEARTLRVEDGSLLPAFAATPQSSKADASCLGVAYH